MGFKTAMFTDLDGLCVIARLGPISRSEKVEWKRGCSIADMISAITRAEQVALNKVQLEVNKLIKTARLAEAELRGRGGGDGAPD